MLINNKDRESLHVLHVSKIIVLPSSFLPRLSLQISISISINNHTRIISCLF
jgi:hypothetical protein